MLRSSALRAALALTFVTASVPAAAQTKSGAADAPAAVAPPAVAPPAVGPAAVAPAPLAYAPAPLPLPPPPPVFAKPSDDGDGWRFDGMEYFFGFFYQDGHGLQSQAGPIDARGSERALVLNPIASFQFRTNKQIRHEVVFPIDVVSMASSDALDVVSQASAVTQAFSLEATSTYSPNDSLDFSFKWGPHFEETLRSFMAGPTFTAHFAQDNTVVSLSGFIVADAYDPIQPNAKDNGQDSRVALNGNLDVSQVLSETTLLSLSVGLTTQSGDLQTSWNSVITRGDPDEGEPFVYRTGELFPKNRFRSAFVFRLAQHIPASHTTVKGTYRFYADENRVFANTGQVEIFQYFVPWLYARVHGRLHVQPAIDFWVPYLDGPPDSNQARTSDSDLEKLVSREAGLRLVLLRNKAPLFMRGNDSVGLGYLRYERTNGLHVDFASLSYSKSF